MPKTDRDSVPDAAERVVKIVAASLTLCTAIVGFITAVVALVTVLVGRL